MHVRESSGEKEERQVDEMTDRQKQVRYSAHPYEEYYTWWYKRRMTRQEQIIIIIVTAF